MISLQELQAEEEIRKNRIENVRTVLVVLSGKAVVYDDASLRQKIHLSYPDAEVYFVSTEAIAIGKKLPSSAKIDLVIDFTGIGHRHKRFFARRLRSRARVCVGRNAGFFRAHIYDRVVDDLQFTARVQDVLLRERVIQKEVLAQAGIPLSHQGDLGKDLQKKIAAQYSSRR